MTDIKTLCGHVALIGLPNAGKSTLLNTILGTKVSIVSRKPQTTRFQVIGIHIEENSQIIFLDTPGLFQAKSPFEKSILQTAWHAVHNCSFVALLVDVQEGFSSRMKQLISTLKERKVEIIVVLNKIDLIAKPKLLNIAKEFHETNIVKDIFMVSALNNDGVSDFVTYIRVRLPESPWIYEHDKITNLPQRLIASEITREKLFRTLNKELPYELMVDTARWEETLNKNIKIYQTIYVRRDSQKAIILGKNGQAIKKVGKMAREELTEMFQKKIHLFLHVKTDKIWHEKPHIFNSGHGFYSNE